MAVLPKIDRGKEEQRAKTVWRGPALPIVKSSEGYWTSKRLPWLLKSSIYLILMTRLGSRPFRRNFGSNVPSLTFEPNDEVLASQIRFYTVDVLRHPINGEPRIRVERVETYADRNRHMLQIVIEYAILATGEQVREIIEMSREGTISSPVKTF